MDVLRNSDPHMMDSQDDVAPVSVVNVEAPVTVVNVDDGDNYDDLYDEELAFANDDDFDVDEEDFVVNDGQSLCLCEGHCPHKEIFSIVHICS